MSALQHGRHHAVSAALGGSPCYNASCKSSFYDLVHVLRKDTNAWLKPSPSSAELHFFGATQCPCCCDTQGGIPGLLRDAGITLGSAEHVELVIHLPADLFVKLAGLYAIQIDKDRQTIHEAITNYLRGQEADLFQKSETGAKAMYACLQLLPTAMGQIFSRLTVESGEPKRFKTLKEAFFGKEKSMGAYVQFTGGRVLQSTAEAEKMLDELYAKDGVYILRGETCRYTQCKSLIANLPVNSILYKSPTLGGINVIATPSGTHHIINDQLDEVIAVRIGPLIAGVTCHSRSIASMARSLVDRVENKMREPTVSRKERQRLFNFVTRICDKAFTKEKVREWMVEHPIFDELKSNSWSPQRFEHAMDELRSGLPSSDLDKIIAQIKAEVTARNGKSARIILNAGEYNQLCSLLVCRCFEDLLFTMRADVEGLPKDSTEFCNLNHIKHQDKNTAMADFVADTAKQGAYGVAIEGDGSAWDTTCSKTVRDCTTNQAFSHIWKLMQEVVYPDGPAPQQIEENIKQMGKKTLKAKVSSNAQGEKNEYWMRQAKISMAAIQESGTRPTSCGNFFVNETNWLNNLFRNPMDVLTCNDVRRRHVLDIRNGTHSFQGRPGATYSASIVCRFEGDDSLLRLAIFETLDGKLKLLTPENDRKLLDSMFEMVTTLWTSWGFNMKLVFAWDQEVVTFCGTNTLNSRTGFANAVLPEILRGLATSSWSVSSTLKQDGLDTAAGRAIARDSYLARAASYPDIGWSSLLRRFYLACAKMHMEPVLKADRKRPAMSVEDFLTAKKIDLWEHDNEVHLPRLTKVTDRDVARKLGCEVNTIVNWDDMFDRADKLFEGYTEEAVNALIEKTAGYVTPDERATLETCVLQPDMLMARALLPASWARRLTEVYESESLNHIL